MKHLSITAGLAAIVMTAASACGGGDTSSKPDAAPARGPITIWYSNNPEEVAWGRQMVEAWNAGHPSEKVTGQEIPAGKTSEEVIAAAITAGNAPCLIYNTAPAAIPRFQKQGGLVPLDDFDDAKTYIEARTGDRAAQYRSPDGKYYQMPWKSNPVMIFYNKKMFAKAGIDTENPPLATYEQFLNTSRKVVAGKAAGHAIWPSPGAEFFQPWFDFYPLFAAETGGKQLLKDGKAQFTSPEGERVASFWKTLYDEKLASKETYNGDSFADGKAAMAIVGPWAISVYKDKVDWGVVPVPTSTGRSPADTYTFSDAKNVAMFSACKNRGTAWDLLKSGTTKEQDGKLLELTGQMPMRSGLPGAYSDYFAQHKAYETFAAQADRTVEVPNVANSIEIWQTFRDAYSRSVIFGKQDPKAAFGEAASKADGLAAGS
ncbi:extracellular solute-binding protein [Actinomadura sp. HBU206391]|uniref:extracellular solute-binding protein n=1 Tax=Actinomadura sp. HBU206391 TaxID=2731692 RepID=UPI00164F697C|nr:extracellular solute-binding protein [Actinomadura sp. HBU206391]MBC6460063.1 extracellular solute-binding protein [Actinomadura sp. HBU206391]